jgi:hypothetical protein
MNRYLIIFGFIFTAFPALGQGPYKSAIDCIEAVADISNLAGGQRQVQVRQSYIGNRYLFLANLEKLHVYTLHAYTNDNQFEIKMTTKGPDKSEVANKNINKEWIHTAADMEKNGLMVDERQMYPVLINGTGKSYSDENYGEINDQYKIRNYLVFKNGTHDDMVGLYLYGLTRYLDPKSEESPDEKNTNSSFINYKVEGSYFPVFPVLSKNADSQAVKNYKWAIKHWSETVQKWIEETKNVPRIFTGKPLEEDLTELNELISDTFLLKSSDHYDDFKKTYEEQVDGFTKEIKRVPTSRQGKLGYACTAWDSDLDDVKFKKLFHAIQKCKKTPNLSNDANEKLKDHYSELISLCTCQDKFEEEGCAVKIKNIFGDEEYKTLKQVFLDEKTQNK